MNDGSRMFRAWRARAGLTQTEAAARLGIHTSEVSRIERGRGVGLARALALEVPTGIPARAWVSYNGAQDGDAEEQAGGTEDAPE